MKRTSQVKLCFNLILFTLKVIFEDVHLQHTGTTGETCPTNLPKEQLCPWFGTQSGFGGCQGNGSCQTL